MGLNPKQDCVHCDKCGKLIEENNKSSIKVLCKKCEKEWHLFFSANMLLIEDEFRVSRKGSPNPTWYVFIGKLKSKHNLKYPKVMFIFR
jgi:hypothetical protein